MRIVIVGGGIMGAALAEALGGRATVTLLEQGEFGAGVTAASGGMMRVYHPEPELSQLAREGFEAYARFRARSGASCGFVRTGMLWIDRAAKRAALEAATERLASDGYPLHVWAAATAREHFPDLDWADDEVAVYEPEAGYADTVATTLALLAAARAAGVETLAGTAVQRLWVEGDRLLGVQTATGNLAADVVILASGTWTTDLLAPLGLGADLYSKAIQTVRLEGEPALVHTCFYDNIRDCFGRPDGTAASRVGVVLAERFLRPGRLPLDEAAATTARTFAAQRFPAFARRTLAGGVRTVDSYTSTGLGLLGYTKEFQGLYLCLGWGGTGFKIAPALARRAVQEILTCVLSPSCRPRPKTPPRCFP